MLSMGEFSVVQQEVGVSTQRPDAKASWLMQVIPGAAERWAERSRLPGRQIWWPRKTRKMVAPSLQALRALCGVNNCDFRVGYTYVTSCMISWLDRFCRETLDGVRFRETLTDRLNIPGGGCVSVPHPERWKEPYRPTDRTREAIRRVHYPSLAAGSAFDVFPAVARRINRGALPDAFVSGFSALNFCMPLYAILAELMQMNPVQARSVHAKILCVGDELRTSTCDLMFKNLVMITIDPVAGVAVSLWPRAQPIEDDRTYVLMGVAPRELPEEDRYQTAHRSIPSEPYPTWKLMA